MATVRRSEGTLPGWRVPETYKVVLTGKYDQQALQTLGIANLSPLSEDNARQLCQRINDKARELQQQNQAQR